MTRPCWESVTCRFGGGITMRSKRNFKAFGRSFCWGWPCNPWAWLGSSIAPNSSLPGCSPWFVRQNQITLYLDPSLKVLFFPRARLLHCSPKVGKEKTKGDFCMVTTSYLFVLPFFLQTLPPQIPAHHPETKSFSFCLNYTNKWVNALP